MHIELQPTTTDYSIVVPEEVTEVRLGHGKQYRRNQTRRGPHVSYDHSDVSPGIYGRQVSLQPGVTNVVVTAWSKHRLTSQVYNLAITRAAPAAAADAKLSALQLSEGTAITFDPLVGWYWVTDVGEAVESLTLTASAAQTGASVVVEPTDADPDLEGYQIAFTGARMRVTVTVNLNRRLSIAHVHAVAAPQAGMGRLRTRLDSRLRAAFRRTDHLWRRTRRPRGDALQFCARIVCARTLCLSRRARWQVRILRHPGQQYLPLLDDRQCPFIHASQPAKLAAEQRHSRMGRRETNRLFLIRSHLLAVVGRYGRLWASGHRARNRSGTSRIRQWPWAPPLPAWSTPTARLSVGQMSAGSSRHRQESSKMSPEVDTRSCVASGQTIPCCVGHTEHGWEGHRAVPTGSSGTTAVIAMSRRMRHTGRATAPSRENGELFCELNVDNYPGLTSILRAEPPAAAFVHVSLGYTPSVARPCGLTSQGRIQCRTQTWYPALTNPDWLPRLSDNPALKSLVVDGLRLVPQFNANVSSYAATAEVDEERLTLLATTADSRSSMSISHADADPDTAGHQVDFAVGVTVITFSILAEDGVSAKTYKLVVTRARPDPDDASLSQLHISDVGLNPDFVAERTNYETSLVAEVTRLTVEAVPTAPDATVVITPPDADPDTPEHEIDLGRGDFKIRVKVTAPDETTSRTYQVQLLDDRLRLLSVGHVNIELTPTTTEYSIAVPEEVTGSRA